MVSPSRRKTLLDHLHLSVERDRPIGKVATSFIGLQQFRQQKFGEGLARQHRKKVSAKVSQASPASFTQTLRLWAAIAFPKHLTPHAIALETHRAPHNCAIHFSRLRRKVTDLIGTFTPRRRRRS